MECRPYRAGSANYKPGRSYQILPKFTGERLRDGSAFYVQVPDFCGWKYPAFDPDALKAPAPADVSPLSFLMDSLENPTVIEAYAVSGYHGAPHARSSIRESRVEFLGPDFTPSAKPQQPFEVPWPHRSWNRKGPRPLAWRGWQLGPADAALRNELPPEPLATGSKDRFKVYRLSRELRGRFIETGPISRLSEDRIPFRWMGNGRYEASLRARGYNIWQPGNEHYTPLVRGERATFVIDGESIAVDFLDFNAFELALVDTQTETVYIFYQF